MDSNVFERRQIIHFAFRLAFRCLKFSIKLLGGWYQDRLLLMDIGQDIVNLLSKCYIGLVPFSAMGSLARM